jgi:serine/threonine-protein kinase
VAHDPLLDRVVAAVGAHYLIEDELGRGGMSVVYRALDLRLNRHVAIKVLPPELAFNGDVRERFLREAQTAAQLSHPNIVPIYSVDEREGVVFFVMALVEGESLGALMKRAPRRPIEEVRRILHDVADALAAAHRLGVIHRDVKPDNILIERATGRPLVTDFGIARAAIADSRLTATGVAVGTPTYMSPEQAIGEHEVDGRSDVYALACVGWQMLAGEPLFAASNTPALLMKHVSEAPRPLAALRPDAPAALAGAIMRALAKQPDARWRSAEQFRDAIGGVGAAGALASAIASRSDAPAGFAPQPPVRAVQPPVGTLVPPGSPFPQIPPFPAPPEPPSWMGPHEARRWRREQARAMRHDVREQARAMRHHAHAEREDFDQRPVADRITIFRRKLAGNAVTIAALAAVNAVVTPDFWWVLFPAGFMTLDVLSKGGSLWADGVSFRRIFKRSARERDDAAALAKGEARPSLPSLHEAAARLVAPEVLAGAHGVSVRRAAAERQAVLDILSRLGAAEKGMITDVTPTVEGLVTRAAEVATTLHRLDADVSGRSLAQLDERVAATRAEPESPECERRLALLERQRTTFAELLERRQLLAGQLDRVLLALETLKLDLLRLRSAGLSNALDDVTSATQQARALSKDIGYAAEAAEDVKKL